MEIDVSSFVHIINFILKQLKIIIPYNLLLAIIIEQSDNLFVVAYFGVEELRLLISFDKKK